MMVRRCRPAPLILSSWSIWPGAALSQPQYGVHRGADLVTHVCQEIALDLGQPLGGMARLDQRATHREFAAQQIFPPPTHPDRQNEQGNGVVGPKCSGGWRCAEGKPDRHFEGDQDRRSGDQGIGELDAENDEAVEFQKGEIENSDPAIEACAALQLDLVQDGEQAERRREDKSRHDRLPGAASTARKGVGKPAQQNRQADRQAQTIGGEIGLGNAVDQEITAD